MEKKELLAYLANQIKSRRKVMGLNQQQVADFLGLSRVQIANIERCSNGTTYENIYNMCSLFSCQVSDLFPKVEFAKLETIFVEKIVNIPKKIKVKKYVIERNKK